MLVRRAEVPPGERRSLACLALAGSGVATGDSAIQKAGFDLLLDEACRSADPFSNGPRDLSLSGNRKIASNVGEERSIRACEVVRIVREASHCVLALEKHRTTVLELRRLASVGIDQVFDRAIDRSRVLIHTRAKLCDLVVQTSLPNSPGSFWPGEKDAKRTPRGGEV